MIISRTPFRVSFFGGGTDYPSWYLKEGGAVLSTTIDKYLYISCRRLPPFFEMRHRIVWSKVENVWEIDEIEHPVIREGLKYLGFDDDSGLDIHYQADLPARTGMGSSSSFAVGLINALSGLKGGVISSEEMARKAIELEQGILNETVGAQDQMAAAYGGLNKIRFLENGEILLSPILISQRRVKKIEDNLMLFYTGISRYAFKVAATVVENMPKHKQALKRMHAMVDEGVSVLSGDGDLTPFGELLNEGWQLKRSLSDSVTTSHVDEIYEKAITNGALGGKLLGAGGGGFILFFVPPERQAEMRAAMGDLLEVPFQFSSQGSTIIHYQREEFDGKAHGAPFEVRPAT